MDPLTQAAPAENSGATTITAEPVVGQNPGAIQTTVPEQQSNGSQQQPTTPAPEMLTIMGQQIDKSKVHPELLEKLNGWNKDYTQKSQEYAAARKKAETLDQLTRNQAFQRWYYEQTNPQAAAQTQQPKEDPFALTPEKQAELLSDPKSMRQYIEGLATNIMQQVALPAAQQAQYEARTLRNEQEVNRLAGQYHDFDDLNNNGKIEAVLGRYAQQGVDIDLEDAYWLAKRPFVESEARLNAQKIVQQKVTASVMAPGGAAPSQIKIVPAKGLSLAEKMRAAFEASLRGEKLQFDSTR